MTQGAPFVGVANGGADMPAGQPMTIPANKVKKAAVELEHILLELDESQTLKLSTYLKSRLTAGKSARDQRINRLGSIDKTISTWQQLSPDDSARQSMEDNTGRSMAIPFNLPVLASHLNDMVSYFAEALAPVSSPFFSANGEAMVKEVLTKFNRDAVSHNYYGNLCMTLRSLLKYNMGGFKLDWDDGSTFGVKTGPVGNSWTSLDLYNTFWDPSIRELQKLSTHGEWAAEVEIENRLTILRNAKSGQWVNLESIVSAPFTGMTTKTYYRDPAISAGITMDGKDGRSSNASKGTVNWGNYGVGLLGDQGPEVDGFEVVDMGCWLVPAQFGLLTNAERLALEAKDEDPETFIELWRFKFVGDILADASPYHKRENAIAGERIVLPYFLSLMTEDQLQEAQRSFMELMKGFQRFSSTMYSIYVAGMRENVWGLKVADPTQVDTSTIEKGDTVGILKTKKPGMDVRGAIQSINSSSGVESALQSVSETLALQDKFFPAQAMAGQVGGIDRAIKSQVNTVVRGATQAMRMILRVLDSSLLMPSRLAGYRNLKWYDPDGLDNVDDEQVAKMLGSGIESMEADRVSDILWQLMYAIIQNQETMQVFDVPKLMTYLSRVGNLSVDLGSFARQPPQQMQQPAAPDGTQALPTQPMPVA